MDLKRFLHRKHIYQNFRHENDHDGSIESFRHENDHDGSTAGSFRYGDACGGNYFPYEKIPYFTPCAECL